MRVNDMNDTVLQQAVVVDLDGTLLHTEPEAIEVRGQSGCSYMSRAALDYLHTISAYLPIVIATGRNAQSVQRLVSQTTGVGYAGFVMEHGLVARHSLNTVSDQVSPWLPLISLLCTWRQLPGYERCLGVIPPPDLAKPRDVLQQALAITHLQGTIHEEGHKFFVCPIEPDKMVGLRSLNIEPLFALGNGLNDLSMLAASTYAVTLSTAEPEVRAVVAAQSGYCSALCSHHATADMLAWVLDHLRHRVLWTPDAVHNLLGVAET